MVGGWQEGKEEKLTEMEGCVYKNEVILGPVPSIGALLERLGFPIWASVVRFFGIRQQGLGQEEKLKIKKFKIPPCAR